MHAYKRIPKEIVESLMIPMIVKGKTYLVPDEDVIWSIAEQLGITGDRDEIWNRAIDAIETQYPDFREWEWQSVEVAA